MGGRWRLPFIANVYHSAIIVGEYLFLKFKIDRAASFAALHFRNFDEVFEHLELADDARHLGLGDHVDCQGQDVVHGAEFELWVDHSD